MQFWSLAVDLLGRPMASIQSSLRSPEIRVTIDLEHLPLLEPPSKAKVMGARQPQAAWQLHCSPCC